MKLLYFLNTYIFLNLLFINSEAQNSLFPTKKEVSIGTYLSTSGQNPFWLRSNQYGTVPLESQTLNISTSFHKEFDSTYNNVQKLQKFGLGYGINPILIVGKINKVLLPEAYIKSRLGAFEFYAGRRREIVGLVDTTLTSGSYIWSGNALPLPKIQISIPNYTSIIGKGLVSIKGAFAHGWFGSTDSTKNFFLHQKYLYGRIGRPNWKVKFYAGLNHQVQWGGRPHKPYIEKETGKLIESYGNDLNTYINVVTGISLNKNESVKSDDIPLNEALNRAGNHLGSIDIGTEISLGKLCILLYRQSIYEDGSLYYLNNISDGLFGFSLKTNQKKGLLGLNFEYLNTVNQGGIGGSENTIPELRGRDNYFNNGIYGWSYSGFSIGTPFFANANTLNSDLLNNDTFLTDFPRHLMANNRVKGVALGIIQKHYIFTFSSKISYFQNLGIYENGFDIKQISIFQDVQFAYKKYFLYSSIVYDVEGLFGRGMGIKLNIKRFF